MFYCLLNEFVVDLVKEYFKLLVNVKKFKSEMLFLILFMLKDYKID